MPYVVDRPRPPVLRRSESRNWRTRAVAIAGKQGIGSALAIVVLLAAGAAGVVKGGEYRAFVAKQGSFDNVLARWLGLGIKAVTITGARELSAKEILAAGHISPRSSLLFLDADAVRSRLMSLPIVKDASVEKFFPNRLVIRIVERRPFALWQEDGKLKVIASDGTPIDSMTDPRFVHLPFVVGIGANEHIAQFMRLLTAAGDLRSKIKAGVYIGERRWNLNLDNGVQVALPEIAPSAAVREFARIARQSDLLGKDLISIDLRMPGRLVVRISEEAAAARAAALAKKHHARGLM